MYEWHSRITDVRVTVLFGGKPQIATTTTTTTAMRQRVKAVLLRYITAFMPDKYSFNIHKHINNKSAVVDFFHAIQRKRK